MKVGLTRAKERSKTSWTILENILATFLVLSTIRVTTTGPLGDQLKYDNDSIISISSMFTLFPVLLERFEVEIISVQYNEISIGSTVF